MLLTEAIILQRKNQKTQIISMVKGSVIKQQDTIARPEVNYRALSALNCSMIKLFDTDPVKFYEQFKLGKKKKDSKTASLIIGDIADFYLLDCKGDEDEFETRFDEKFALFEGTKGSGQVFVLADTLFEIAQENTDDNNIITTSFDTMFTEAFRRVQIQGKYKGGTEEKALKDFSDNGMAYYQSLMDNIGKVVVDISLLDKAKRVAELLRKDEFTKDIFSDNDHDIEYFPKFAIEWKYLNSDGQDIDCKSELDIIKIDHKKKVIYPKDLKTAYDNENFDYSYIKYRYDLQAAFYYLAIKHWATQEGMSDYTVYPMEFIVGDTSANNRRPIRYKLQMSDITNAISGYSIRGNYYKGIRELIDEISWAEKTNNWNVSKEVFDNNGILKINIKYE